GNKARNGLAKIPELGDGTADATWDPNVVAGALYAMATDGGNVYIGGAFVESVGGQPRSNLAKISGSGTGAVDPLWDPDVNDIVFALAASSNGTVYAGGQFNEIDGEIRLGLATLTGPSGIVAPTGPASPQWAIGTQLAPQVFTT